MSFTLAVASRRATKTVFLPIVISDGVCGTCNKLSFERVDFRHAEDVPRVQCSVLPKTEHSWSFASCRERTMRAFELCAEDIL